MEDEEVEDTLIEGVTLKTVAVPDLELEFHVELKSGEHRYFYFSKQEVLKHVMPFISELAKEELLEDYE